MNKNAILTFYEILQKETDIKHQFTMKDLQSSMKEAGCSYNRKTLSNYIKQLEEFGIDIVYGKGRYATYFLNERILELEELQWIIDSVNATNVIGKNKTNNITNKLKSKFSKYEADQLDKSVIGVSGTKTENKQTLINIGKIREAIKNNSQIKFDYYNWNEKKEFVKKGETRILSPFAFIVASNRYYIFGYRMKNGELESRHYRLDKLKNVEVLENEKRYGNKKFKQFNANEYVSRRIGIFDGDEINIKVIVDKNLSGVFIDQFGCDEVEIASTKEKDKIMVSFTAAKSTLLCGWLMALNAQVMAPESLIQQMTEQLKKNNLYYGL